MNELFDASPKPVSAVTRSVSKMRAQRERLIQLGNALSSGELNATLPEGKYGPDDLHALNALSDHLAKNVTTATLSAAEHMAAVFDGMAKNVLADIGATAARVSALREIASASQTSVPNAKDQECGQIIEGQVAVVPNDCPPTQ